MANFEAFAQGPNWHWWGKFWIYYWNLLIIGSCSFENLQTF